MHWWRHRRMRRSRRHITAGDVQRRARQYAELGRRQAGLELSISRGMFHRYNDVARRVHHLSSRAVTSGLTQLVLS